MKARENRRNIKNDYNYNLQKYLNDNQVLLTTIQEIQSNQLFEIVSEDIFCSKIKNICKSEYNNNLYYVDRSHPSQFIINKIAKELEKKMKKIFK